MIIGAFAYGLVNVFTGMTCSRSSLAVILDLPKRPHSPL
jgi:hypothetical protein